MVVVVWRGEPSRRWLKLNDDHKVCQRVDYVDLAVTTQLLVSPFSFRRRRCPIAIVIRVQVPVYLKLVCVDKNRWGQREGGRPDDNRGTAKKKQRGDNLAVEIVPRPLWR